MMFSLKASCQFPMSMCLQAIDHAEENSRCHEGKLFLDPRLNSLGVDHEAAKDVVHEDQQCIRAQEHFRNVNPSDSRVVERTLHPLRCICPSKVSVEVRKPSSKRGHTL